MHYYNNERIQRKLDNMSLIAYKKHIICFLSHHMVSDH
ncbi:hypothetical protein [Bacillus thuringiensis]